MTMRPPKIGKLSTQFACALAKRCMKGDRLELSGVNPFAGTALVATSLVRIASMRTNRHKAQETKPVKAARVGLMLLQSLMLT
jgi:hypothetical protein